MSRSLDGAPTAGMTDTRPNIVLIVFDTARADAFEPYGAPAGASPAMADLASQGAASEATYSTACWTIPAHLSLFSGRLPRSAGFRPAGTIVGYRPLLEARASSLLPSVLGRAGYQTVGLSTNGLVSAGTGFGAAFEEFEFLPGWRTKKLAASNWRTRLAWYQEALRARLDDGATELQGRLESWLSNRRRRPFFWFVNLVECHSPYFPPQPYNDLGASDRLRAAHEARRYLSFSSIWKCSSGDFDVPPDAIERMRYLYTASIRQLDDWLASVLDAFSRHGVLDETQIVVTSDHGENLGDGQMLGHAFSLDDRLLRVPLVTAGPHGLPAGGLRSLSAIPAWLADIAEVRDQPFTSGGDDGVAVAQFDAAMEPGDSRVTAALRAWRTPADLTDEVSRRLTTSFTCATDGTIKLARRLGSEELFDLVADPLEERPEPVSAEHERVHRARLAALRAALDRAEREAGGQGPDPSDDLAPAVTSEEETAELEAQMRLLGYL